MEPMGLCQFPFSLGATRARPRRSHDDASAADSVPLILASWSDPCRWRAAVGEAGPSAITGRYSLNLSRGSTSHRHKQDKYGIGNDGQLAVCAGSRAAGCSSELNILVLVAGSAASSLLLECLMKVALCVWKSF